MSGIFAVPQQNRRDLLLAWVATPRRALHVVPGRIPCGLIAPVAGRTGLPLRTAPQFQHAVLLTVQVASVSELLGFSASRLLGFSASRLLGFSA
ncbi:hypothetical protein, partial [Streptomyces sp. NPDC058142]|uniref:hypothetical protein n=1 Tax=Streptomyces sp. NPDC058142 TaxID=3346355 RepID=UPI0036E50483